MAEIPVERCITGRDLTEPRLAPDGSCLVYAVSTGRDRALLWQPLDGSAVRQLTAYPSPATGRGMGGGCWCWLPDATAVIYAAADGELWLQPVPGGGVRRLTFHGPQHVAAAPVVTADGTTLVYVIDEAEVWSKPTVGGAAIRLDDGSADFCFDPALSPAPLGDTALGDTALGNTALGDTALGDTALG
ncbi:MAG: hypothetical protein ABIQ39_04045, partial [Ilumatobacteraceae bacterium]